MKNDKNPKINTKKELPHAYVILFVILILAMVATWVVPAGQYGRYLDPNSGRNVVDPTSFAYADQAPVNPFQMFVSIQEGLIAACSISFLIFTAYSALYMLEKSGAVDAIIAIMVRKTKAQPKYANIFIILIVAILSAWGSTGTLSYEEIFAFVPIFVSIAIALGYDAMVGLAISVFPVGIGFASATVNPFTIGVAQTIAELPMFSGLGYRLVIWFVMTAFLIIYVMAYGNKIKKDPTKSIVYGIDMGDMSIDEERLQTEFTTSRKLGFVGLVVTVGFMAWGLLTQGWYVNQCSALFIMFAIYLGIVNRWSPNKMVTIFIEGMGKAVMGALLVGFARSILVVMEKGMIMDTLVNACVGVIEELSLFASSVAMLIFQTFLNFLIPSGSGQAAVSMPIMTPIADLIGMNRQIAVLAFQFGDGFSNLLWPTGFAVIGCAMAKIPINRYYKWFMPFFAVSFVLQVIFMFGAVAIDYQ
ncbi:MAG: YfcC family protein [Firmicutes bacterium]|nr:YfcC family protein [Bacillota bacterium]